MLRATVQIYGSAIGPSGMREPYSSYLILSSDLEDYPGLSVATIIGVSGEKPFCRHVQEQTEGTALKKAVKTLKDLPENTGLKVVVKSSEDGS